MQDAAQIYSREGCPSFEIAAYIDGELDPVRESELELHLASCPECTEEMNLQKQFLCSLNSSLKNDAEIELPANFTKTIVANAEGSVSGLRRPRERFNAIFICSTLLLFGLFALGAGAGGFLDSVLGMAEKSVAVASFVGRIAYSVLIGVNVLLRSFGSQAQIPPVVSVIAVTLSCVLFIVLSRRFLRLPRT